MQGFRILPSFHADPADYLKDSNGQPKRERLSGAQAGADPNEYFVYHKTNTDNGPAGRYLVNNDGVPVYLADPGINGVYDKRPDGSSVQKFTAPKATLVSYIIKGILGGQLPWGLVLLGVFIAIVLELSGVSALAFAVGVYLPISTSAPVYVGGMVRWLVDRYTRRKHAGAQLTEDSSSRKATRATASCFPPATSPAAHSPACSSPSSPFPMKDRLDAFRNGPPRTIHSSKGRAVEAKKQGKKFFFEQRIAAHEQDAEDMLKRIQAAEVAYSVTRKGTFGDLNALVDAGFVPKDILGSETTGYRFTVATGEGGKSYVARAEPERYRRTGRLSFYMDASGIQRKDTGGKPLNSSKR
jgi:hypothetical protein